MNSTYQIQKLTNFELSIDLKMIGNILVIVWVLWLQSGTVESSERLKREIKFPKGGSFTAAVALASFLPKGPTEGLAHVLEFDLGFPFPDKLVFGKKMKNQNSYQGFKTKSWYQQRSKRSIKEKEKKDLLFKIEDAITRIGFNGTACVLRFQCELRNTSPDDSLLGELLFAMFNTSFQDEECEMHGRTCPVSLLQIVMHSEQISPSQMI